MQLLRKQINHLELNLKLTKKELTFQNLIILKEYWKDRSGEAELHMPQFGDIYNKTYHTSYSTPQTHLCGTTCCLLGLAPEVLEVRKEHFVAGKFNYLEFSATHFPYLHKNGEEKDINVLWYYLFHPSWPDDLDHALQRIDYVVEDKITKALKYNDLRNLIRDAVFYCDLTF